jgi:hypothetical protein
MVNEGEGVMPQYSFEIEVKNPGIGFALEPAIGGMTVHVCTRGFFTPMDGIALYNALSSVSSQYLSKWLRSVRVDESIISNCLIQIKNGKARVYINIPLIAIMASRRDEDILKGEMVVNNDIADIRELKFQGVEFESGCGSLFIFSIGWRKFLYFDMTPLLPKEQMQEGCGVESQFSIEQIAPLIYSMALFPEAFYTEPSIMEKAWKLGWFPYIRILGDKFNTILHALTNNFSPESCEIQIVNSFDERTIRRMVDSWMKKTIFKQNEIILRTGVEHYLKGEYIAALHILYPRIEGLMQLIYLKVGAGRAKQEKLVDSLIEVAKEKTPRSCLFFMDKFGTFLKNFYFADFNIQAENIEISRNSISHGVVDENELKKARALQAILILDQMYFYL